MDRRNKRFLIGSLILLGLFLFAVQSFAGRTSTAFPSNSIPYQGDAGIAAAQAFFGTSSDPGYMGSLDAVVVGLSANSDSNFYDSSESAIFSGIKIKAGTVDLDVALDVDATVDFANTVVFHGELQTLGNLNVDSTANFVSTVTIVSDNAADKVLIVKAASAQTGNLTEWQDNSGNLSLAVESDGDIFTDRWIGNVTNTVIGVEAMGSNALTTSGGGSNGLYNTSIGNISMQDITTGHSNTGIGFQSLLNVTTGTTNTAIGRDSLYNLTTGTGNVAIGYLAGSATTDGTLNMFIGQSSGASNASGTQNLMLGRNSGANNTGSYNTYVGSSSGAGSGSGGYNVSVGYSSAPDLTNGTENTIIGMAAGDGISTGNYGIAIGARTDFFSSGGNYQLVIGYQGNYAIAASTMGTDLTLYGTVTALSTAAAANALIVKGASSQSAGLQKWVDSSDNVLIYVTNEGDIWTDRWVNHASNTFLGVNVANNDNLSHTGGGSNGYYNTVVGNLAGEDITTGYLNVVMGYNAMPQSTTGQQNVAIGANTLGASGSLLHPDHNVAVGDAAGQGVSGNYNTFIGPESGSSFTTGSYNIIIGYDPTAPSANNASNQFAVGTTTNYAITANTMGDDLTLYGDVKIDQELALPAESNFAAGDTTPSIDNGNIFATSSTATAYTIVDFDSGTAGQVIYIRAVNSNTDFTDGGNLNLASDWTPDGGDIMQIYTPNGTAWYEISRSAN